MSYLWEQVIGRLYRQKWAYLLLMLEFALGTALFTVCVNYFLTTEQILLEYKNAQSGREIRFECYETQDTIDYERFGLDPEWRSETDTITWTITMDEFEDYPLEYQIPFETYEELYQEYSQDVDILFDYHMGNSVALIEGNSIGYSTTVVYYMNDELFESLYGIERRADCVYMGASAYEELVHLTEMLDQYGEEAILSNSNPFPLMRFVGDMLQVERDGEILSARNYEIIAPVDDNQNLTKRVYYEDGVSMFDEGADRTDMSEAVIFPLEDVADMPDTAFSGMPLVVSSNLVVRYRGEQTRDDTIPSMQRFLTEANPTKVFRADDEYLQMKNKMDDLKGDSNSWLFLSISMILLSGIGCIGFLFIRLDRRRHAMAAAVACGALYRRLKLEHLLEIGIVLAAGGALGIGFSLRLRGILLYQGEIKYHLQPILAVAAFVLVFTFLSVTLGMHTVRKRDIIKLLREE